MTTENARRFFKLPLAVIALLAAAACACTAQQATASARGINTPGSPSGLPTVFHRTLLLDPVPPDSPATTRRGIEPVAAFDTTPRPFYDRLFGVGAHLASSSYISGATTLATHVGFGAWATITPLQYWNIQWLQVDFIYTHVQVPGTADSSFLAAEKIVGDPNVPPNTHNTFDISLRFTANPSAIFNFYGSFGFTRFHNEFGVDQYIVERAHDTSLVKGFIEDVWGVGGAIGISVNLAVPYATIAPTAEWRYARIPASDRGLAHRHYEFAVSQPRIGVLIYPNFRSLFH